MQNIRIKFSFLIDDGECYHTDDPGIGMEDFYYLMALDSDDYNETCESLLTHYQENKILSFTVQCTEATTICDIQKVISDKIGFVWSRFLEMPLHTAFFCDGHFVHVRSPEVTLSTIRKWYNIENELRIFFVLCDQAGTIWHDDGLRYFMHSREAGRHNTPHIHIDYKNEKEVSLSLLDGRILDGTIPNKALKIAQKRVADNQQFLLECWNKCTDGLHVDINHFLGTVPLKIATLK